MKTIDISPAEMDRRVARFSELRPYKDTQNDAKGIPPEAMEMMSAKHVFPVMAPEGWIGRNAIAPVKGAPGLTVSLAQCPPGDSPGLHAHETSVENFFCVQGRFEISWGDAGEHSLILEPNDFVSVPPGVARNFTNISNETGMLLVMIQIAEGTDSDVVAHAASVGEVIASKWGADTLKAMEGIGIKFTAGADR